MVLSVQSTIRGEQETHLCLRKCLAPDITFALSEQVGKGKGNEEHHQAYVPASYGQSQTFRTGMDISRTRS